MKIVRSLALVVSLLLIWVVGCEVADPGSPYGNQPPTTILSRAPLDGDTVNHYIELRWAGNDVDGTIQGFRILIDGVEITFTQITDTLIAFSSTADGLPTSHTFSVIAVDDDGAADPSPPQRQFYTTNEAPAVEWGEGTVPSGAEVGYGFRMVLKGLDDNRSLMWFSLSIADDQSWSEWSQDSIFYIGDTSLDLYPDGVNIVSNEGLSDGEVTIYARVQDAGGATSEAISRTVNVASGYRPAMNPVVTGAYGSEEFYPDGSVYRRNNVETQISYAASAEAYYGQIQAYRYEDADGWSEWTSTPSLAFTDISTGQYPFKFTARDIAGVLADTIEFEIRIVEQQLTSQILLIDETRDGNGNPGSPTDEAVDAFYHALLQGRDYVDIDYASRPGGVPYVSPYDLGESGLVIWHGDDRSDVKLGDNTDVLTAYLNKGGRLILSGWDVLAAFNADGADTLIFANGSFAYDKLRIFEGYYNRTRSMTGIEGVGDLPSITIDPDKLPNSFNGTIDRVWVFTQRGECSVTGVLTVNNPEENPLSGKTASFIYDQSFRVLVFGAPLFFFKESEVVPLMDALVDRMLAGL
ncbi:hypothetical protein EH220_06960 [bacterium]|nr:MAG: hypothetical protein EH220_06960 [bacterium]